MIQPFLDVLLIEELPVEDALATGVDGIQRSEKAARKPMYGKVLRCDSKFPMAGLWVDMPYKPGDVVKTSEFGRNYVTFSIEDEKPGATKYYLIRYEDIEGLREA